jgi:16S rRNA (guanine527-N7)-methyltransferase
MSAMDIARIAELLSPFARLSESQLQSTSTYIDILQKWNARVNLTAIRDPEQIVARHFGESYFSAQALLDEGWSGTVVDFGSGAGFPGIPIAISRPKAAVTLIESNGKKAAFLGEVASQLGLANVAVFCGRGEAFTKKANLVAMRAVESFELALGVAAGLVDGGGRLGLLVGQNQLDATKAKQPGFHWHDPILIPMSKSRILLVGNL